MNTILKTLLYEWKDRTLPKAIRRNISLDTRSDKNVNNATVITGFRRSGKTYLIYEAMERLLKTHTRESVIYLNFEDERIISPSTSLLTDLIPEIQAVYGRKPEYLFLDELQLIPRWSKWVRRILDTESLRLYITGSSSKMSSSQLPTELRGRAWEVKVNPLTFPEFLRFKKTAIDTEKMKFAQEEAARFRFLFDEYLTYGGLPAVTLTLNEKKQELLQSYFQTVVQMDITERYKIENDLALKTLLKLLLNSSYITISKLANSLKSLGIPVGKSTIDRYITYIKSSYFMQEVSIHKPSVVNQLQYPRKVYFVDTGFITALSTKFSQNTGRLFENVVYNKLSKSRDITNYYKDDKDNEVDFAILKEGKTARLIQACIDMNDEETLSREVKSLLKSGKLLGCDDLNIITLEKPDIPKLPYGIKIISAGEFFLS